MVFIESPQVDARKSKNMFADEDVFLKKWFKL